MECREGLGHPAMQHLAARGEDLAVGHFAHPVVREVEMLAHAVQHAPADQLLHAPRDRLLAEPGHAVQETELELAPHHGGQRHQVAAPLVEPIELAADDVADALGQGEPLETGRERLVSGRAHRLDHDEGIPPAGAPYLLAQVSHRRLVASGARESPDEVDRVLPRERAEGERVDVGLALPARRGSAGASARRPDPPRAR